MKQNNTNDQKHKKSPDWWGSAGWALSSKEKGGRFDSQSGHMPGLQVWSPSRGT